MTTVAERLVSLAGAGGAAGALLLSIGGGTTAGTALLDYSGLADVTAAQHLLVEPEPNENPGRWFGMPVYPDRPVQRLRNEEAALLTGLI